MSYGRSIPDSQLVFSAELAATIGLEEAVLIQQIRSLYLHQPATVQDGKAWLHVSEAYLLQLVPFWNASDLGRLCRRLDALGLIHCDLQKAAPECLLIAIREKPTLEKADLEKADLEKTGLENATSEKHAAPPAVRHSAAQQGVARRKTGALRSGGGEPLPRDFMPSEDMLELLEQFHQVPRAFALEQLEDFTLYWRERGNAGHAWQNKFRQHVQFQWARQQQERRVSEHAETGGSGGARRTRDSSLEHDLNDTSWAD